MHSDLKGLAITPLELKKLSGIDIDNGVNSNKNIVLWITILLYFPSVFICAIFMSVAFSILEVVIGSHIDKDLENLVNLVLGFPVARYTAKFILQHFNVNQNSPVSKDDIESLSSLKSEVIKFNSLVEAISVNDQLREAGNEGLNLNDRIKIIEALKLTKKDLVRALKTERILRENKGVISTNPELFANSLTTLKAWQVSDKATEYGQLLNNVLQIAVEVQKEMKKLQNCS